MDPLVVLAVCAVVLTIMAVVGGVALILTLFQIKETARRADDLTRRLEPTITEVELAVREWRQVGEHISSTAESAQRLTERFEGVGTKAAQASQVILGGIGGPVGRTMALVNALKTGADVFFRLTGRNQNSRRKGMENNASGPDSDPNKEVSHAD